MRTASLPSLGDFTRFYAPLVATSLLLTATNPLLAAALARTADPTAALAGYSVAFALCGVLYSPLLVVQQVTATRILEGGTSGPVRRFAILTGIGFSGLAAAVAFTAAGEVVFRGVVGVTGAVYGEARDAMTWLWPVPLLTAVRAMHQGRLVADHRTHPIALATGARTGVLAVVAFVLTAVSAGAWLGAAAFTAGLVVETLIVAVSPTSGEHPRGEPREVAGEIGVGGEDRLLRFSGPLMLNVLLWWATPLLLNAVLARTPAPERALAAFAVVEAVAWFVTAPVGQLQHASIAMVGDGATHRRVRRWAGALALAVAAALGVLALPPVREPLLRAAFQLDPQLVAAAGSALPLAVLYPLLYAHRQYFQGLLVRTGWPGAVGWGAVLRVGAIGVLAVFGLGALGHLGARLGVGLAVAGLFVEGAFLERMSRSRALPALEGAPSLPSEAVVT